MRRRPAATLLALAAILVPAAARAQAPDPSREAPPTPAPGGGWLVGASAGLPGSTGEASFTLATVGFTATRLHARRLGVDVGLALAPYTVTQGALGGLGRLGVALPLPLGAGAWVVPSAGVSGVGGASINGSDGTIGGHGALALVLGDDGIGDRGGDRGGDRAGARGGPAVRAGVTLHRFGAGASLWHAELGLGWRVGR